MFKSVYGIITIVVLVLGVVFIMYLAVSNREEIQKSTDVAQIAEKLGMDVDQFNEDYRSEEIKDIVEAQKNDALNRLGGSASTPAVFIEGVYYDRATEGPVITKLAEMLEDPTTETPIRVEVFEDYNCNACAAYQNNLFEIKQTFLEEQVDLQLKHLPFLQASSTDYARAAETARKQGMFEEYNYELYMLSQGITYDFYPAE